MAQFSPPALGVLTSRAKMDFALDRCFAAALAVSAQFMICARGDDLLLRWD